MDSMDGLACHAIVAALVLVLVLVEGPDGRWQMADGRMDHGRMAD